MTGLFFHPRFAAYAVLLRRGFFAPLFFTMLRFLSALLLFLAPLLLLGANETSEPAPLAAKSLLLDIARAGSKLVAVGERGHVLVSADEGRTWTQSVSPTRAMLTGVHFASPERGWAVGHDGVIIATADGGRTWKRQDGGQDLDTVFLDVLFLDETRGFAVGAYGKFYATSDGGNSWMPRRAAEEDLHFNRIMRDDAGTLFLIGEAGTFLVSEDAGASWQRREVPYEGSLFAGIAIAPETVIVAGLRGHIFVSANRGEAWANESSTVTVLISAATRVGERVVLAGQGGNFFISQDGGKSFHHWKPTNFGTSIAELISTSQGLLSVGEAGAVLHQLP